MKRALAVAALSFAACGRDSAPAAAPEPDREVFVLRTDGRTESFTISAGRPTWRLVLGTDEPESGWYSRKGRRSGAAIG